MHSVNHKTLFVHFVYSNKENKQRKMNKLNKMLLKFIKSFQFTFLEVKKKILAILAIKRVI